MDDAQVDRVRRALRRRSEPPWRVVWPIGPSELWASTAGFPTPQSRPALAQRAVELAGTIQIARL
jgi:hypothetical protein